MPNSVIQDKAKDAAGKAACDLVQSNMTIGLGTGSTVKYFIEHLGLKCQKGLKIQACVSSIASENQARTAGIPLIDVNQLTTLDLVVDGADEIDPQNQMIKGGGGALLREKIIASMTKKMVVIVDESKCVQKLGTFPLPIEILPFAYEATLQKLEKFKPKLRMTDANLPYQTDNLNFIADLHKIDFFDDLKALNQFLHEVPGILETGLFLNFARQVIVGYPDGTIIIR